MSFEAGIRSLFFISLLSLLLTCSGSPPLIQNVDWMPVLTKDSRNGKVYEELNFYAQLEDGDGIEDIELFSICKDDEGWSWNLGPEDWVLYQADGETWIGSAGLTRGGILPQGDYRLLVRDRSGQKSEKEFRLNISWPELSGLVFPSALVSGSGIELDGGEREPLVLWFYDEQENMLKEVYSRAGSLLPGDILDSQEQKTARFFVIYWQDEQGGYGLKSGPFFLHPESSDAD